MGTKRRRPGIDESQKHADSSFKNGEVRAVKRLETVFSVSGASGCYSPGRFYDKVGKDQKVDSSKMKQYEGKDQKMDNNKIKECAIVLKKLMTHPVGWVFNQPVDPVKLKIPDYFSIISKPMDLGTIKCKLEKKLYTSTRQFAADVRLTFSNAMRYNPPVNDVHIMAKELDSIFGVRWKSLEEKWRQESHDTEQLHSMTLEKEKQNPTLRQVAHKKFSCSSSSLPRRSLTCAAELKSKKDLLDDKTKVRMHRVNLNSDSKGYAGEIAVAKHKSHSIPCPSTPPPTVREGDDHPIQEPLSPSKALRVAMLKSRFADTILKTQQKILLNHGEKVDPEKMQREREKLEKAQKDEKARIEAQIKAKMEVEAELRMRRAREREAARLSLQKMERTVHIDNSSWIFKELESFCCSPSGSNHERADEMVVNFMNGAVMQSHAVNPLEQLGLFMKIDDPYDDDDDWIAATVNGDVEEGEICC